MTPINLEKERRYERKPPSKNNNTIMILKLLSLTSEQLEHLTTLIESFSYTG